MPSPLDPRASGELGAGSRRDPDIFRSAAPLGPPPGAITPPPGTPAWLSWLQVGLSTMLMVLFLVTLVRNREQNQEIQRLRQRVRLLEASRSVDRSEAQDAQLRAMAGRIQTVEDVVARRLEASERERQRLEQQLLDLHTRPPQMSRTQPSAAPTTASPPGSLPRLRSGAPPIGSGVMPLRPPAGLP